MRRLSVPRGGERPPGGEDESPWDAHNDDDVVERHPGHVNEVHRQYLVPQLYEGNIKQLTKQLTKPLHPIVYTVAILLVH